MNSVKRAEIITVLQEQVQPALGCTEPVAIALACAKGARTLGGEVQQIVVSTSKAVFKNAHAVGIPKTAEQGILIAAALGALAGDPELRLQVLNNVQEPDIARAKQLVRGGKVQARFVDGREGVYVEAKTITSAGEAVVCIEGQHDHLSSIIVNGHHIFTAGSGRQTATGPHYSFGMMTVEEIVNSCAALPADKIAFLLDGVAMNKRIAAYGVKAKVGLGIGAGLALLQEQQILGSDIVDRVKTLVAAASDARMAGADLPVMASCGSGNQGIVAILPVAAMAEKLGKNTEALARALAISHLVNAYVKEHLGKLSPICGCAVSAGLGAAAAITWLLGGNMQQITGAMKSIVANLTGMLCDGAKGSCSFKLATSAGEAIICSYLALNNVYINVLQGIVEQSIEATIKNFSLITKKGMAHADEAILEILLRNVE